MSPLSLAIIALGVAAFCLVSRRLETAPLTAPMAFTAFGLFIGGLGLAEIEMARGVAHTLAEATLVLVLFSDAARINLRGLRADPALPARMLAIGMPLTILIGAAIALLLPLGLGLFEAALLAALLAPTDAALGQAVVSNRRVPARIRQALNVESGLNDGVALPVVLVLAAGAGAAEAAAGEPERNWALFALAQVSLGPLVGALAGLLGAAALLAAARRKTVDPIYEGATAISIAVFAFAASEAVGGNGFIAAFVAGLVFGARAEGRCAAVFAFAEAEGQILVLITFLVFGAALLPIGLGALDGWVLLYGLLSLTVVRMLPVAAALTGSGLDRSSVAFLGWFGPRGLASILFALLVVEELGGAAAERILAITVATVGLSVFLHGATAAPLARRYADFMNARRGAAEMTAVDETPTRHRMAVQDADPDAARS